MNIHKTIKTVNNKSMEKDNNYKNHLDNILNSTDIQRFNPFSMLDTILKGYAVHNRINFIVTDKGCRSKRKRDYDKEVFAKTYLLLGHSDGRFRQKWISGNVLSLETNRRISRVKGPSHFYLSAKVERFAIYIMSNTCKLLMAHYDDEMPLKDLEKKLKQRIYAINKKLKCDFKKEYLEEVYKVLMDFIKAGWRNYLRGGSFARRCGRPSSRVTVHTYRPRLFVKKLTSKEGQDIINEDLTSKGTWDKTKKHNTIKAMTTYYASNNYLNNIKKDNNKDSIEVIKHCMNNSPKVMHNYTVKPVHNLFKTKINTEHCSYYVRKDYKKINSIRRTDQEKPQQPITIIGKYFQNYLDKWKNIY